MTNKMRNCNAKMRGASRAPVAEAGRVMEVLAVTIFLSLLLAGFFVVLFLGSHRGSRRSVEQDALMPLDDGERQPSRKPD